MTTEKRQTAAEAREQARIPGFGGWYDDPILGDVCIEYRDAIVVIRHADYCETFKHIRRQHDELKRLARRDALAEEVC